VQAVKGPFVTFRQTLLCIIAMHDSDFVETLSVLREDERTRFFSFLVMYPKVSENLSSEEVRDFCRYVFGCLDTYTHQMSKPNLWKNLNNSDPYTESKLDALEVIAVKASRDVLKKKLKKRITPQDKHLESMLASLDSVERKTILEALNAQNFEEKEVVIQLVALQCQYRTQFEQAFDDQTVYHRLFGDAAQIHGKLAKYRSETLKVVRRFIALESAQNQMSELQEWVHLQRFFHERNCIGQYQRVRNQVLRRKAENREWSAIDYYHIFSSEAVESNFQGDRNETETDQNLWETIQSLDEYYLVERLLLGCQLLDQNQTTPLALPPLTEWWHIDIHSHYLKWFFDKPIGKLFSMAFQLLADENSDNEANLRQFIHYLRDNEPSLSRKIISHFEIYAMNYAIRRINRGNFTYAALVFELQQRRVEKGRIYVDGKIMANEFQSITALGLRLGNYDWIASFIERHQKKVVGSMSSLEYYQLCMAMLQYHKEEYLAALQILMNAEYEDLQSKMLARILEIKVLCELELQGQTKLRVDEQLDARIEAGILFFFRLKDVPVSKKKMGKRFMDFMKKIIRAKENRRWSILEKIQKEVAQIDLIAERQWLLKTIERYHSRNRK
jgi:hypothetical protein